MDRHLYCQAILFDLDGVLVDSREHIERHWLRWASNNGVDAQGLLQAMHGVPSQELIRRFAPHLDPEVEADQLAQAQIADSSDVRPIPGATELVSRIPLDRWGVVTSGRRDVALVRLHRAGIPVPPALVTADMVTHGKPHPAPYLLGATLLNLPPQECVVVEDAQAGIQAARAAGMRVIGIAPDRNTRSLDQADEVIASIRDIQITYNHNLSDLLLQLRVEQ